MGLQEKCDIIKDLPHSGSLPHGYYDCDVSSESSVKNVFEQVLKVCLLFQYIIIEKIWEQFAWNNLYENY